MRTKLIERLRVIGRSEGEEVELDSVKVGQKVYPISGRNKHKVAKVVQIMPDGKTVLVKFEHPVGNRYAKYVGNELSTYEDGEEVGETNKL